MFKSDADAPVPRIREGQSKKAKLSNDDDIISVEQFSDLIIYQKGNEKVAEVITRIPENDFYKQKDKWNDKFSGILLITDINDNLKKWFRFRNGKYEETRIPNGRLRDQPCTDIDWYSLVCVGGSCSLSYDYTETYGACDNSVGGGSYGSSYEATAYNGATGFGNTGGGDGVIIFQGDENKPIVNPFQQVKCFRNNTADYTYELTVYVDQPGDDGASSSDSWFNVGHAFVGLRKVSKQSGEVTQRTFGFYPQSSWSAISGTGGTIHTNEGSPYDVSIKYTLTPQQMDNAANAILNDASHEYVLAQYNCTNFAKSVCDAAGVSFPRSYDKMRIGGSEIWFYSPGRTGQALRNASGSNPNIEVRNPNEPKKGPNNSGDCP